MEKFSDDPVVAELAEKLKARYKELEAEVFDREDFELDEFSEMNERYYSDLRESDPDDVTLFQIMWFS